MVLLVPPLRFSVAAANPSTLPPPSSSSSSTSTLYRGAYPRQRHLPFLSRLKLKSILSLTPKPLDETIADWANHHSIRIIHIRCEKPKEEAGGLTRESAAKALMVLLDSRNLPLYVHCLDGQDVTSLLIACLRKLQGWSSPSILSELARGTGAVFDLSSQMNFNHSNSTLGPSPADYQVQFVSKFGVTPISEGMRLPSRRWIPDWCWVEPSPLSRLRNPYDLGDYESHLLLQWQVRGFNKGNSNSNTNSGGNGNGSSTTSSRIYPTKDRERKEGEIKRKPNEIETNNGNSSDASSNSQIGKSQVVDGEDSNASKSPSPQPQPQPHLHSTSHLYLPVLHPTIRLRFDPDPTLPPIPIPQTPIRPSAFTSTQSQRSQSRPVSRTGRVPLPASASGSGSSGGSSSGGTIQAPSSFFQGSDRDRDRDHSHSSSRPNSRPGSAPTSPRRRPITIHSSPILSGGLPTSSNEIHPHLPSHAHAHSPLIRSSQLNSPTSRSIGSFSSNLGESSSNERTQDQDGISYRRIGGGTSTPPPRPNQLLNSTSSLGRSSSANPYSSWSNGSPTRKGLHSSLFSEDENESGEISTPRARSGAGATFISTSSSSNRGASSSRLRTESSQSSALHGSLRSALFSSSSSSSDDASDSERGERSRRGQEKDISSNQEVQGSDSAGIDIPNSNNRLSQLREGDSGSNHLGLNITDSREFRDSSIENQYQQQGGDRGNPNKSAADNNDDGEGEQTPRRALQNLPTLLSEPFDEINPVNHRLDFLKNQASKGEDMLRSSTVGTSYLETTSSTNSSSVGSSSPERDPEYNEQGNVSIESSSSSPSPSNSNSRRIDQSPSMASQIRNGNQHQSPTQSFENPEEWKSSSTSSRKRPASMGYENSYGFEEDHSGLKTSPKSEFLDIGFHPNRSQKQNNRTRSTSLSLLSASASSGSRSGFSNVSQTKSNDSYPSDVFVMDSHGGGGGVGNGSEREGQYYSDPESERGEGLRHQLGREDYDDQEEDREEIDQDLEDVEREEEILAEEDDDEDEEEDEEEEEEEEEDEESEGDDSEGDLLEALDLA